MKKVQRVLLAHCHYRTSAPSGEDIVFENEKNLLLNNGVDVVSYELENDDLDDTTFLSKSQNGLDTVWSRKGYRGLLEAIRCTNPDVVHFHNTFPQISPSGYDACVDMGVPVVQTLHNYRTICPGGMLFRNGKPCEDCLDHSLLSSLKNRCYRGSILATSALALSIQVGRFRGSYDQRVNRYIALTKFAASRVVKGGLPQNKIVVKPNFLNDPPAIGNGDGGYAIYVGRLSKEKGLLTLFQAWRQLLDIPLVVVGDGPMRNDLECYARDNDLPVQFRGQVDADVALECIRAAMFQIVPSEWYEGFPMVIVEALACGTPVVASAIGSLIETVPTSAGCKLFPPQNSGELVEAVRTLLGEITQHPNHRATIRRYFESKFDSANNFAQLMAIYDSVVDLE